jgi:hypothetical protein
MLKLAFATILVTGLAAVTPTYAETNGSGSGIGRGCTLDPFTKTMRCIDFDNCTTDKNGKKTCPVVVTPYGNASSSSSTSTSGGGKSNTQQYLIVKMNDAMISSY